MESSRSSRPGPRRWRDPAELGVPRAARPRSPRPSGGQGAEPGCTGAQVRGARPPSKQDRSPRSPGPRATRGVPARHRPRTRAFRGGASPATGPTGPGAARTKVLMVPGEAQEPRLLRVARTGSPATRWYGSRSPGPLAIAGQPGEARVRWCQGPGSPATARSRGVRQIAGAGQPGEPGDSGAPGPRGAAKVSGRGTGGREPGGRNRTRGAKSGDTGSGEPRWSGDPGGGGSRRTPRSQGASGSARSEPGDSGARPVVPISPGDIGSPRSLMVPKVPGVSRSREARRARSAQVPREPGDSQVPGPRGVREKARVILSPRSHRRPTGPQGVREDQTGGASTRGAQDRGDWQGARCNRIRTPKETAAETGLRGHRTEGGQIGPGSSRSPRCPW